MSHIPMNKKTTLMQKQDLNLPKIFEVDLLIKLSGTTLGLGLLLSHFLSRRLLPAEHY